MICISYKLSGYTDAGGPRPTMSGMDAENLHLNLKTYGLFIT